MSSPAANSLPFFTANQPMAQQLTAARLNSWIAFCRSIQPQRGVGTLVKQTPGGTTIDAIASKRRPSPDFPWKVSIRAHPDEDGKSQAMVYLNSSIFRSDKPDDTIVITGLDSWFNFEPGNDLIWVYVTVSKSNIDTATIQSYGQGQGGFDPTAFPWNAEQNGYMNSDLGVPETQINFNVPIFYSTFDDDGKVQNVQMADTNLLVKRFIDNGISAMYVEPTTLALNGYEVTDATIPSFECNPPRLFPFQVTIRRIDAGTYQAKINYNSDLLLSLKPSDNLPISGLDTWFPLIANDVIWIYIVVSNQTAVSAKIQSYGQGDGGFNPTLAAWDDDGGYVQDDGGSPPNQIAANVMLGWSTPDASGAPRFVQVASTHFVVKSMCIDGRPAQFVQPSPYGKYGV